MSTSSGDADEGGAGGGDEGGGGEVDHQTNPAVNHKPFNQQSTIERVDTLKAFKTLM